jgi:hypothetical protein
MLSLVITLGLNSLFSVYPFEGWYSCKYYIHIQLVPHWKHCPSITKTNRLTLWKPYKTHKYTLWGEWRETFKQQNRWRLFNDAFFSSRLYNIGRDDWRKNWDGFGRQWSWLHESTTLTFAWRALRKPRRTSGTAVEIRTEHLPDRC